MRRTTSWRIAWDNGEQGVPGEDDAGKSARDCRMAHQSSGPFLLLKPSSASNRKHNTCSTRRCCARKRGTLECDDASKRLAVIIRGLRALCRSHTDKVTTECLAPDIALDTGTWPIRAVRVDARSSLAVFIRGLRALSRRDTYRIKRGCLAPDVAILAIGVGRSCQSQMG